MKHLNLTPKEFCFVTNACQEGRIFSQKYNTMAEVWDACLKVEWLLWILRAIDAPANEKKKRLFAVWCARNTPMHDGRTTGALLTDSRSVAALEVAERFANGNATEAELAAAWSAARTAAFDAASAAARSAARTAAFDAARAAAWSAARFAAFDAARAAAWSAARTAAFDAASAAARAASRTAAFDAARTAARAVAEAAQANQLRVMIKNPFVKGAK